MPVLVVVGAQWGDEGKGKIVDYATRSADWAVRYQGGNNAGHTLVVNGVKTKLSLIPSGVLHEHSRCLIGAGVVVTPRVLLKEMDMLAQSGVRVEPGRLVIDRSASLILDYHILIDQAREAALAGGKIGTTGRGIGPAYEDRAGRSAVLFADLLDPAALREKVGALVAARNEYLCQVLKQKDGVDFSAVWEDLQRAAERLVPYIGNGSLLIADALKAGQKVVCEGAQGTLLDQTHGTIPFVTSSHTLAGAVTTGIGLGPKQVDYVLGIAKAYCTRVGAGPFPTELNDAVGDAIRERGAEFGTVTGRPRRCGWFDAVALRRAVRLNGLDSLAIMKLDVLSGLEKVGICVSYRMAGREVEDLPPLASQFAGIEPEIITMKGWQEPLGGIGSWDQLPPQARAYLSALADAAGCPISIVSVGAEREETIFTADAGWLQNFVGR